MQYDMHIKHSLFVIIKTFCRG